MFRFPFDPLQRDRHRAAGEGDPGRAVQVSTK